MYWKTRTHGSARQVGKRFPVMQKKHLPKLNIPKQLMSASLPEHEKKKIGFSVPSGGKQTGKAVKLGDFKVTEESIKYHEHYAWKRDLPGKLVMMTPDEFLRRAPSMVTAAAPASLQKKRHYNKESLNHVRGAILQGRPLEVPFIDYSDMKAGWPTHDGRHRAFAAKELGIEKIPVYIIGEEEVSLRGGGKFFGLISDPGDPQMFGAKIGKRQKYYQTTFPSGKRRTEPFSIKPVSLYKVRKARFQKELTAGTDVEMEHTKSRETAKKIALDHLKEDPQYYTKLFKCFPGEHSGGKKRQLKKIAKKPKLKQVAITYFDDKSKRRVEIIPVRLTPHFYQTAREKGFNILSVSKA